MAAVSACRSDPSDPAGFALASLPAALADLLEAGAGLRLQGYRGRFAPSPSGALHRGNLRTALLSWLDARLQGGVWLLRIDDLDTPRNREGAGEAIEADLRWLGLIWDGSVVRQSAHRGRYATVLSALRRGGLLYPCRCSRRMLADISAPHARRGVYPGTCRPLRSGWGAEGGRLPSWRLRLRDGPITWEERFAQPGLLDGATAVGDPVLRRADGFLAYHLVTAIDELALGISDVVRGEDLWPATAPQVAVIRALGQTPPRYGHVPLWCDGQGRRLSKREASEGMAGLRARGLDAAGVVGELAASLALVPPGSRLSAEELLASLDHDRFTQALRQGRRAEAPEQTGSEPGPPPSPSASPAQKSLRI